MVPIREKVGNFRPTPIPKGVPPSPYILLSRARVGILLRRAVAFLICTSALATGAHSVRRFTSVATFIQSQRFSFQPVPGGVDIVAPADGTVVLVADLPYLVID